MDKEKADDQITLTPHKQPGQKEAGASVTLMDKTKEASQRKNVNPMDIQLEHGK